MTDQITNRTTLSETEILRLGEHWPDIPHWSPRSTEWGTTNATFFVGDRDQYLLKIYGGGNLEQLRFEHTVLLDLGSANLPYAVPCPHLSASGAVLVPVDPENDRLQAAVYPIIPGRSSDRGDTRKTFQVGAALGQLHRALETAPLIEQDAVLPSWGDLDRIHPQVPEWRDLTRQLGMETSLVEGTARIVRLLDGAVPQIRSRLPQQVVHADYVQPNILFHEDRVSGVIDFEFATWDLRAFDLAASLYHFCLSPWADEPRWPLLEAFLRGYASANTLFPKESDVLPMLLRWQRMSCLVYWTGMYRQGLATYKSLVAAAEENLRLEGWIDRNGGSLIEKAHEWCSSAE